MADPMRPTKIQKTPWLEWNSLLNPFKHAFGTWGFLRSPITNLSSKLANRKSQIQYGGQKWKKLLVCDDILYSGLFAVADYESKLKSKKFETADLIWQTKVQNLLYWDDILYVGVFGVADYR